MSSYVVFDSHCDTAYEFWKRSEGFDRTSCCIGMNQMQHFSHYSQFFAFCTYAGLNMGFTCEELLWKPYGYFKKQLKKFEDLIFVCSNIEDYNKALQENKYAAFLSLEGAEGINCDPGRLEELRQCGFSMINLTWNADNPLAGCAAKNGGGLTEQGREFVRRAQELGIIIDVSHVSDEAFWDIMDITQKPVVASHSNSRVICEHPRNLTDDQFKHICQSGGYVGINLYTKFLTRKSKASFDDVFAHIEHFVELDGADHIALGGDLDGCDQLPEEYTGLKDYELLASYLESKGLTEQMLQNIYSNTIEEVVKLCTM